MRLVQIISAALALALLATFVQGQSIQEPRFVNKFLDDFSTPVIVPGHDGRFSLSVNNPDPGNLTMPMVNATLEISIYHYATLEESIPVSQLDIPPVIMESGATVLEQDCGNIEPGGSFPVEFNIETEKGTPHGSYFSQSTYFVRFILAFDYAGQNYTFASHGHFNDTQWSHLTETETGPGEVNHTYLHELGYDGIIPDSAFSVKKPIPMWPFYGLVALTCFVGLLAFSSYVLDNPGSYPKLERRLLRLSGQLDLYRRLILRKFRK